MPRPLPLAIGLSLMLAVPTASAAQDIVLTRGGVLVDTEPLALGTLPDDELADGPLTRAMLRDHLLISGIDALLHPADDERLDLVLWLEPPYSVVAVELVGQLSDDSRDAVRRRLTWLELPAPIEAPVAVHLVVDTGNAWWPTTRFDLDAFTIEATLPPGDDTLAVQRAALTRSTSIVWPSPATTQAFVAAVDAWQPDPQGTCVGTPLVATLAADGEPVRLQPRSSPGAPCDDDALAHTIAEAWERVDELPDGPRWLVLAGSTPWPDPSPTPWQPLTSASSGSLRAADIQRAVGTRLRAVEACQERALLGGVDASGTVEIWMRFDGGTGEPLATRWTGDTTGFDALVSCVHAALEALRLPAEHEGHAIEVTARFDFVGSQP